MVWNAERTRKWKADFGAELAAVRDKGSKASPVRLWLGMERRSKVMVWTPEQTGTFLDHATEDRLDAMFHTVAFTGLRRGELCGLEWPDVDLDAGEITVRIQRVRVSYRQIKEDEPKTDASAATVPIDPTTVKVLRAWRKRQQEERLKWGQGWINSAKVFTRENGESLHPEAVSRLFARLALAAGLPPIRLHDLRHGAATLMLAGGAEMELVQAVLRHSSITITSDTYTSVLPDVVRQAVAGAAALSRGRHPERTPGRTGSQRAPNGLPR